MTRIISTDELVNLQRTGKGIALLNVLSPAQYRKEHVPGSASAPLDSPEFLRIVETRTDGDKHVAIVVYGSGEGSDLSSRAARALAQAGYDNVAEYSGGMEAWNRSQHRKESQARPSPEAMASIAAAVRSGKAGASLGELDLDDQEELELAGSERGAEREHWNRTVQPAPPATGRPSERSQPSDDVHG